MPSTPTSTTSGPSSAPKVIGSRPSAASGIASTVPDGVASSGGVPGDAESVAADGRLIRDVRRRLVLWSGLSTLLVLVVLGAALYLVVARNLEANGVAQLNARAAELIHRDPRSGPGQGFSFGGGSSGTFAVVANEAGQPV